MISQKDMPRHIGTLQSIEAPIDLLARSPIHSGFEMTGHGKCVSCFRDRAISKVGNCLACGQLRQAFPTLRLQSHIIIAEFDRPTKVFTSQISKQEFHEDAVVNRSDNYWQAAFQYAVSNTDAAAHPFIMAIATSKQPLSASQIKLNSDPERLIVSFNPAWDVLDASDTIDLAASRKIGEKDPFDKDSNASFAKRIKALEELGITREVRATPEWRLHAIITGQRKTWQ